MAIAIANRYAHALAEVVSQAGDYRQVQTDLESFLAAYQGSPDLRVVLDSPAVPIEGKIRVLEAIAARMAISKTAASFVRVLVTNFRIGYLDEVCAAFTRIANEKLGVVSVKVFSATALSDGEQQTLRARFEAVTRKRVLMEFHLDATLLGGIQARIHSTVYDGSVRGHLDRIREQLLKG
jgi:F-type H+-transporting ATPase subunit delta